MNPALEFPRLCSLPSVERSSALVCQVGHSRAETETADEPGAHFRVLSDGNVALVWSPTGEPANRDCRAVHAIFGRSPTTSEWQDLLNTRRGSRIAEDPDGTASAKRKILLALRIRRHKPTESRHPKVNHRNEASFPSLDCHDDRPK
jgi:hypothetical protein